MCWSYLRYSAVEGCAPSLPFQHKLQLYQNDKVSQQVPQLIMCKVSAIIATYKAVSRQWDLDPMVA